MIVKTDRSKCSGCTACAAACSVGCITMKADAEGFLYPVVDESRCVHCGRCDAVCPAEHPILREDRDVIAWGAKAIDEALRMESSSGGVFSLLALETLRNGGVVFGAALRDDCRSVHHIMVQKEEDLAALRGSKYLQSDLEDSFRAVKEQLQAGKQILFSGTPCQNSGLKAFLGRDYEGLLTVAIICHGAPSPKLWNHYLDHLQRESKDRIAGIRFRSKDNGWRQYQLQLLTKYGKQSVGTAGDNPYLQMFLKDQCLRQSCYQCAAKDGNCGADLILGDFWGVENVVPELDDDKGTSLVLSLTEKGKQCFSGLQALTCIEVETEKALQGNPAYRSSVCKPTERGSFYEDLSRMQFGEMQRKYLRLTPKQKVIRTLDKMHLLQPVCKILGK